MKYTIWFLLFGMLTACSSTGQQSDHQEPEIVEVVDYHDNGVVFKKGQTVDGKRQGKWESFYPNGYKWSETEFNQGRKEGVTTVYYPNGMMRYTGRYYDDARTGMWILYDTLGVVTHRINTEQSQAPIDSLINAMPAP